MSKQTKPHGEPKLGGAYAHYVLFVLVIVYVFNFVDRNILSILSQNIQADLGASDAQMGYLYGTVFAIFYAVFGNFDLKKPLSRSKYRTSGMPRLAFAHSRYASASLRFASASANRLSAAIFFCATRTTSDIFMVFFSPSTIRSTVCS